jgi:HlyD family secretion protein
MVGRMIRLWGASFVSMALALATWSCATGHAGADLVATTVQRRTVERTVTLNGVAFPRGRTAVWPAVTGRVMQILVHRSDRVTEGQPLLQLDSIRAQRDVEARELALLRSRVARARASKAQGTQSSPPEVNELEQQIAAIDQAQASRALDDARKALAEFTVRAPRQGVVVQMNVRQGQIVAPGSVDSTSYLAIADDSGIQIDAEGDEFEVAGIATSARASIDIDALDMHFMATVDTPPALTRVRSAGLSSSMYLVRLSSDQTLPIGAWGMTARVNIVVRAQRNVPALPPDSVVLYRKRHYVIDSATGVPHVVTLGLCAADVCEVVSGVTLGDHVLRGSAAALARKIDEYTHGMPDEAP